MGAGDTVVKRRGGATSGNAVDPLTGLRPELPLMGSNWLCNFAPQGEVDRAAGWMGSAEVLLTPRGGPADGEQLGRLILAHWGRSPKDP